MSQPNGGGSVEVGASRRSRIAHIPRFACTWILAGLLFSGCGQWRQRTAPPLAADEWHEFQGTWTAVGDRQSIMLGGNRRASITRFEGSLVLTGNSRPGIGFRAEVVTLNDTATGMIGRAVWTDEHGDQAFSELKGESIGPSSKIVGTFLGGTGRYEGAIGTYEFSWRYILENDDGTVQGQSLGLTGRVHVGMARSSEKRGPKS